MKSSDYIKFVRSWIIEDNNLNSTGDLIKWIGERNQKINVSISKICFEDMKSWDYDDNEGSIKHSSGKFFSIEGIIVRDANRFILEQPMINQNEIGFLGIIVKEFNGIMYFLMQAKIEPGNVNKVQISPTIQATRSNFSQIHKGEKPKYIEYFINSNKYEIIVDQLQSEQSSRFLRKRNRNIIIKVNDDIELTENFRWMTLKQIKQLLKIDNLVNMDARTVISCIPFNMYLHNFNDDDIVKIKQYFGNSPVFESLTSKNNDNKFLCDIYNKMNNYKMFDNCQLEKVALKNMKNWMFTDFEIYSRDNQDYRVIFCDIEIEGREVKKWTQPLFEAKGKALFGFFVKKIGNILNFLVKIKKEIGCFDVVELGPTIQLYYSEIEHEINVDDTSKLFLNKLKKLDGILYDVVLSEEGGRFYHEQNRNVIIQVEDIKPDENYFWVTLGQLNLLNQFNNILNIQARNLLSLLEA